MKAKKLTALLLAGMMAFSLAACGGSSGAESAAPAEEAEEAVSEAASEAPAEEAVEEPAEEAGEVKKVGIAMPTKSLERWNRDGSFLEKGFQEKGFETVVTFSDNDIKKQVSDIENLIADNVDLLVIAAIDG